MQRPWQQIRNKGRQAFLASPASNFSRIVHDYTDERKGFMVWKDMLEERVLQESGQMMSIPFLHASSMKTSPSWQDMVG